MASDNNWPIYGPDGHGFLVNVSSFVLFVGDEQAEDVLIDNPGPIPVFVKAGGPDVVATLQSVRVPPGGLSPFRKGEHQYLAMLTATGTQDVTVHTGIGQ